MTFDTRFTYTSVVAVTPSDATEIRAAGLWVGGAGAVTLRTGDDETVLISGVPAGTLLPIQARRVHATGTTATLILALN